MNQFAGSKLSSKMKPFFWARASPFNFWRNYGKAQFLRKSLALRMLTLVF